MKHCRHCQNPETSVIRESVIRRGSKTYRVAWLKCPRCGDLSFHYQRPGPESRAVESRPEARDVDPVGSRAG